LELQAWQLALPQLKESGANLVAISPQKPERSLSTFDKHSLEFDGLIDAGNSVARQFGIVFGLPQDLRQAYSSFGIDLPEENGDDSFELPIPATYVIDKNRKIRMAFVDPDYTKRADPEDVMAFLAKMKEAET
jgi:peroxiredoxin